MEGASDRGSVAESGLERVHRLEFGMEYPPNHVAAYLLDGPEPVLIDAGIPGEEGREALREELAARGYGLGEIDHVAVTHPHTDHAGQVGALLEEGARLYAPAMVESQLGRDPEDLRAGVRETAREAGLPADRVESHADRAVASLERNRRLLPPGRVDVAFEFGEPVAVGDHVFTPIHTPGHQAAHAGFAVGIDGQEALFSGDALIEPFVAAALQVGLDRGAYDAVDAFHAGLGRLGAHDPGPERVFPGHGPVFGDFASVLAATCERLADLVDEVEATVAEVGPASPHEITLARVGDIEQAAGLLDTIGALGYLEGAGRVRHDLAGDTRRYRIRE